MSAAVSTEMQNIIRKKLDEIAREENIRILFAAESGSRAWGFHSNDSDYDVRFIYARPLEWHLSLASKRDVVERPISDELDLSGWELSKALRLAIGSNAVIAEWLQSPIVYSEVDSFREELMDFCTTALTRKSVVWHYVNLTKRQHERLIQQDGSIKLKRYFYCLRPTFALRWMRLHEAATPPMNMFDLMEEIDLPQKVTQYIHNLIEIKHDAGEMGLAATSDPDCDALITNELALATEWLKAEPKSTVDCVKVANAIHAKYSLM